MPYHRELDFWDRLERFWYRYDGAVMFALLALVLAGLVFAIYKGGKAGERRAAAACAKMWTMARTSADSIQVVQACEMPRGAHSQPVPVVIPMVVR